MRIRTMLEGLESRRLLSAVSSAAASASVIGPTSGNYAASASATFLHLTANEVDQSVDTTTNAALDSSLKITIDTDTGGGGIDASHLVRQAIQITNQTTGVVYNKAASGTHNISALIQKVKTSGGGDILVITPNGEWAANTTYTVEINGSYATTGTSSNPGDKVRDVSGDVFADFTAQFRTGSDVATPTVKSVFNQITQSAAGTNPYTAEAIGPDQKLYAATTNGLIYRFNIASDGTLTQDGNAITTIQDNNGGPRIITGIAFSPLLKSTDTLSLYVSHGQYRFGNAPDGSQGDVEDYAENFTGKISIISGANLQNYEDLVINIPRSVKDHMNNQIVFDPKGKALYFGIAAMNAMGGDGDDTWGDRVENIYSGTIMQLRLGSGPTGINTYLHNAGPVNLMIDGNPNTATGLVPGTTHYNIFKGSSPLRIYADGIRNDFDMVFASNGHLYAGINGSSAGGNTPATPTDLSDVPVNNRLDKGSGATALPYTGPTAPGLSKVETIEEDTLLDVKNGAYYGHPDAARGEYVLDGGNPTAGVDPYEFAGNGTTGSTGYAVGQQPDRNYTDPIYDFGQDFSPDGLLQYQSVGGKAAQLDGYVLVARYSSGSDILALKTSLTGAITETDQRISGFTGLNSPLDIVEDKTTGNIYVAELTSETTAGAIVMLKASVDPAGSGTGGTPILNKSKLGFYVTPGSSTGVTQTITLTNTGTGSITIDRSATRISSRLYRKNFSVTNLPATDKVIAPGGTYTFQVKGVLAAGQTAAAGVSATPNTELAIRLLNTAGGSVYATVNLRAFDSTKVLVASYTPPASGAALGAGSSAKSSINTFFAAGEPVAASVLAGHGPDENFL